MITATLLTPPGSAAIAVIGIDGVGSNSLISKVFFPANRRAETKQISPGIRFGNFGTEQGDEVVLLTRNDQRFEIHSHGGTVVVEWILQTLMKHGARRVKEPLSVWTDPEAGRLLPRAKTVRCASILLDQAKGAYLQASQNLDERTRATLAKNARVGPHLVDPWNIVIAGRPNAGKSSLMNALAGYSRSVVSAIPGTTRDTVSLEIALDGWPIRVTDTAGLRNAVDEIESEGIRRATQSLFEADLVIWLGDLELDDPLSGFEQIQNVEQSKILVAYNKCDYFPGLSFPGPGISAINGDGVSELVQEIVTRLVPDPPMPGEPVPYTPELAAQWLTTAPL